MLLNNAQRLKIWMKLDHQFDYETFTKVCVQQGCGVFSELDFSCKVGLVLRAIYLYPYMHPAQALSKLVNEPMQVNHNTSAKISGVGKCCGGGETR